MRVCAGCDHEYPEELSFCGKCGRPFGGKPTADVEAMNRHLRQLAASAERDAAMVRANNYTA